MKNFMTPRGRYLALTAFVVAVSVAISISAYYAYEKLKVQGNEVNYSPIIDGFANDNIGASGSQQTPISLSYIFTGITGRKAELYVALASLLAQRSCPINFHFAVDAESKQIVQDFFKANSKLQQVNVSYHTFDVVMDQLKDLKTSFHRTALYKSSPELIFSEDIGETVILDFDFIHVSDFCPLYRTYFELMRAKSNRTVMAIAPETTTTYTHDPLAFQIAPEHKWRPDWNGLNAGLYFVDLQRMRAMNWTASFKKAIAPHLVNDPKHTFLRFPEQNIFNYMGKVDPDLLLELHPGFNLQIGPVSDDDVYELVNGDQIVGNGTSMISTKRQVHILHGNMQAFGRDREIARNIWWLYLPGSCQRYRSNSKPELIQQLEEAAPGSASALLLNRMRKDPQFLLRNNKN